MPVTSSWLKILSAVAETMLKSPTLCIYRIPSPAARFFPYSEAVIRCIHIIVIKSISSTVPFPETYFDIETVLLFSYDCFCYIFF